MKEALFYEKLTNSSVRCQLCQHQCRISQGQTGQCRVRKNIGGKLFSLVYGKVIAGQVDPIEKKPLFNFLPGSKTFGVSTVGCNFRCQQCLNWSLAQTDGESTLDLPTTEPLTIIAAAKKTGCLSIAYTYNEPTVNLEYNFEVMKLAYEAKLKNVWVSNGYMSEVALKFLTPYLDAINVDLKGFSQKYYQQICQARLQPVLDILKLIKKLNRTWLEITTLVIPTLNDSAEELKNIAQFIYNELGAETPWHLSAFSPDISWQLQKLPPTPVATLERAYQIGKDTGLENVYLGNITTNGRENTYCPHCQNMVIERLGYQIKRHDQAGHCASCGQKIALVL